MKPNKKLPLYIITGASGVGKSTACEILFQTESDYIVLESDLLWHTIFDTPADNYCAYRRLWMRMAANVMQISKPVVLCGCGIPEQFEHQPERELFSNIRYFAVTCDGNELRRRMETGRGITDERWIDSSLTFNEWLKTHADKTEPNMAFIDNTTLTPAETAQKIDEWIRQYR